MGAPAVTGARGRFSFWRRHQRQRDLSRATPPHAVQVAGAFVALTATFDRLLRGGGGGVVDVSLAEVAPLSMENRWSYVPYTGAVMTREFGYRNHPLGMMRTADGWIT